MSKSIGKTTLCFCFCFCFCFFLASLLYSQNDLFFLVEERNPISIAEESKDITIITAEELTQYENQTLSQVLKTAANLEVKAYGATGSTQSVYIRGFSGSCVAILINGIQVNSSQTGEFDLNRIAVADIERIEIVSGASDSKYAVSGASGGIIQIVTKKNSNTPFKGSFSVSNAAYPSESFLDTQKIGLQLRFRTESFAWNVGANGTWAKNEYPYIGYKKKEYVRTNNSAILANGNTDFTFYLPNESTISISDVFHWGTLEVPGPQFNTNIGFQKDIFNSLALVWDIPFLWNGLAENSTQASWNYDQIDYTDLNGHSLHTLHTFFGASNWAFYVNSLLEIRLKIDGTLAYLQSTNCSPSDILLPMAGFQLGGNLSLPHNINLYPSVKIVTNSSTWMPVPKIGFEKQINNSSKLTFNGFGIFTFPTLNQLYWADSAFASGNKNLENEKGWGADIGFYAQNSEVEFLGTAYTAWYQNKIQWATVQGKSMATNVGEAAYFGGSLQTKWKPTTSLLLSLSYDCNATFLLTGDLTLSDNRRIMYTPLHTASFETRYTNKKYSLSLIGSYTGKQYLSNANAAFIDPYFLLDFYGSYYLGEKLTIKGSVINLMNVSFYRVENYPMPGISVSLGLTYEF